MLTSKKLVIRTATAREWRWRVVDQPTERAIVALRRLPDIGHTCARRTGSESKRWRSNKPEIFLGFPED
jgi:hypothetical protein